MTHSLPEPLTPAECDLRGMPYMPLDIVRLFDSDLYALSNGAEFKAAFSLWGKSFLQVPAASLPDDDRVLAHLSGAGVAWKKLKPMALRGWIKCSDGRLYHPVVAEKAKEAWNARLAQRARTEAARAAREARRREATENATEHVTDHATPTATEDVTPPVTVSVTEAVTGSKGEGEGEGELREKKKRVSAHALTAHQRPPDAFDQWWQHYPRKVGKDDARKAYAAAVKRGATHADLASGLQRQRWPAEVRFIPHPATWLNQGRWQDDPNAAAPPSPAADRDWWAYPDREPAAADSTPFDLEGIVEPSP